MSGSFELHRLRRTVATAGRTAMLAAAWILGIVAWLGLALSVGAQGMATMSTSMRPASMTGDASSATSSSHADEANGGAARRFTSKLKPSVAQPKRSQLPPLAIATPARAKAEAMVDVHRFYNRLTGMHFYTASESERAHIRATWPHMVEEGVAYRALATAGEDTVPVWRFYNRDTGAHFYTTDAVERQRVLTTWPQFLDEGVAYHSYRQDAFERAPVHRFYNHATRTHFYTADLAERDHVQRTFPQFAYEGVVYYGVGRAPGPGAIARILAHRLVDQSTFGPTPAEVDRALAMGAEAWVADQLAKAPSGYPRAEFNYESLDESEGCKFGAARDTPVYRCAIEHLTLFKIQTRLFQNALQRPDQLRQRVAWALSQILVVSGMKDPDMETAYVEARWHQMLAELAFGNFEELLYRMSTSPAMGHYLDTIDNFKANPLEGTEPNENFARELLQLFSIGVVELKRDGTPFFDSEGQPVATYGQSEVRAFARALTGWTYPPYPGTPPKSAAKHDEMQRYYGAPMVALASEHDSGPKRLLRGIELPAGQTADADLRAALRNVFLHPNVGPFIGRQLIRHLVTGAPTPAYVDRVATVFDDNGAGVRGDLGAVVRAILLDPEARSLQADNPRFGRFREPVQYVTAFLRATAAASDGMHLDEVTRAMGQNPFYAPSVFNYYPSEYRIPGTDIVAPPMALHNANTVLARSNFVYWMLWEGGMDRDEEIPGSIGTTIDLKPWIALAADARKLVVAVDDRFFGGAMPPGMKSELYTTLSAIDNATERAKSALFLAATSFQYQVAR